MWHHGMKSHSRQKCWHAFWEMFVRLKVLRSSTAARSHCGSRAVFAIAPILTESILHHALQIKNLHMLQIFGIWPWIHCAARRRLLWFSVIPQNLCHLKGSKIKCHQSNEAGREYWEAQVLCNSRGDERGSGKCSWSCHPNSNSFKVDSGGPILLLKGLQFWRQDWALDSTEWLGFGSSLFVVGEWHRQPHLLLPYSTGHGVWLDTEHQVWK